MCSLKLFYCTRACSILCYSVLFCSILCYAILCYSVLFYAILFYSILFYSILFYFILFYSTLFYSILLSCKLPILISLLPTPTYLYFSSTLPPHYLSPLSQIVVNVGKRFLEDDAETVYADPCVFANFMDPGSEPGGGCYLPVLDTATLKVTIQ